MLLRTQHICVPTGTAQKEALGNSSRPLALVRSCCVESNFCSVRFAQYFSTRLPVSGFIGASGNSERWKMTGKVDNVGFLATGTGVEGFQPSLRGCFVIHCRRLSAQLRLTKHANMNRFAACLSARKRVNSFMWR
jgi:hypothetical protein